MKSYCRSIICCAVLVLLLSACGPGAPGTTHGTTQPPEATPTKPSPTAIPTPGQEGESCLADLYIYPGSQEEPQMQAELKDLVRQMEAMSQTSGGEVAVYVTADAPSKVVRFYQENPPRGGWNRTLDLTSEEGGIIVWEKGDLGAEAFVAVHEQKTVILLGCGSKLGTSTGPKLPTYTEDDGLADDSVIAIAVAADGSAWFGTSHGLSHFDSSGWKTYTKDDGLPSNCITAVAMGADGSLWVGTDFGGAAHFDGSSWKTYTKRDGLRNNKVSSIAMAPDGTVWVGSCDVRGGISRFDGQGWTTYDKSDGLGDNCVEAIVVASDGTVWAGTKGGVSKFDGTNWTNYTTADGLAGDSVNAVAVDQNGAVWVGTDSGVSRFDGQTWTTYTPDDGLVAPKVSSIAVAPDGSLWFGTHGGVSHLKDGSWQSYTKREGLPSNTVTSICVAPDGRVWIGTAFDGVAVLQPSG